MSFRWIFHHSLVHWRQFGHGRVGGWRRRRCLLHSSGCNIGSRRTRSNSYSNLALKVGCHPGEANCIQFFHTFIRELRLQTTQSQGVFTSLLHDPSTKGLVSRIVLWHIDISIVCFGIFEQLIVSVIPSRDGCRNTPLKANRIEFFDSIGCQTRFGFGSLRQLASRLEIGFSLVFSLDLDPLPQRGTLRNIAMSMFFFPLLQFFVTLMPSASIFVQHGIPDKSERVQYLNSFFTKFTALMVSNLLALQLAVFLSLFGHPFAQLCLSGNIKSAQLCFECEKRKEHVIPTGHGTTPIDIIRVLSSDWSWFSAPLLGSTIQFLLFQRTLLGAIIILCFYY